MKKYLVLVKHSLPEILESVPAGEWKLSEQGRIRARHLAEQLDRFGPEVIVSSIEPKARETAEIIADRYNLEPHIADGLHEHERSKTPYLSGHEFQAAMREFFERPDMLVFGSETANEAHVRFYQAVQSVLDCHSNGTVVIVAHGTVISLFVSHLTGISDQLLWHELGLPSFLVIDIVSGSLITRANVV